MQIHYILSVSSSDKPGVVEAISSAIESCHGSWLDSKLAHLCGKFVGVVRVRINRSQQQELEQALSLLENQNIHIQFEQLLNEPRPSKQKQASFTAVGPDRNGIVKELSAAFTLHHINVEELETNLSSMPYSGEPIFEAKGILSMPLSLDMRELLEKLDTIANELGLDLDVDAIES